MRDDHRDAAPRAAPDLGRGRRGRGRRRHLVHPVPARLDAYARRAWAGLVLDEAQFVKNHQSKTYQCARQLPAPFKLAITGTPMENNLMELWSLLSIAAPGLFPSPTRFAEYYRGRSRSDGDAELLAQLRRRIRPLMLRRTKEQVAADLPPKQEQVLEVELHPRHRKVYQTHLQRERQKVLGLIDDIDAQPVRDLPVADPAAPAQPGPGAGRPRARRTCRAASSTRWSSSSREVAGGGHRALVFSQFTGFLGQVRERLDAAGIEYCYLDGTHPRPGRRSSSGSRTATAPVFLISLKAGGFGLNLTEADYCFLLDPWWNPATEAQAVDRTHRIGQTRNVMVYRLVAKDTIEEKVMALKARKAELFASVMDDGDVFGADAERRRHPGPARLSAAERRTVCSLAAGPWRAGSPRRLATGSWRFRRDPAVGAAAFVDRGSRGWCSRERVWPGTRRARRCRCRGSREPRRRPCRGRAAGSARRTGPAGP